MPKPESDEEQVSFYDDDKKQGRKTLEEQDAAFRLAMRSVLQAEQIQRERDATDTLN